MQLIVIKQVIQVWTKFSFIILSAKIFSAHYLLIYLFYDRFWLYWGLFVTKILKIYTRCDRDKTWKSG